MFPCVAHFVKITFQPRQYNIVTDVNESARYELIIFHMQVRAKVKNVREHFRRASILKRESLRCSCPYLSACARLVYIIPFKWRQRQKAIVESSARGFLSWRPTRDKSSRWMGLGANAKMQIGPRGLQPLLILIKAPQRNSRRPRKEKSHFYQKGFDAWKSSHESIIVVLTRTSRNKRGKKGFGHRKSILKRDYACGIWDLETSRQFARQDTNC